MYFRHFTLSVKSHSQNGSREWAGSPVSRGGKHGGQCPYAYVSDPETTLDPVTPSNSVVGHNGCGTMRADVILRMLFSGYRCRAAVRAARFGFPELMRARPKMTSEFAVENTF